MNTSELTHEHMQALEKLLPTKSPDYIDKLYLGAANYVHDNIKYLSPHDEEHLIRMGEKAWPGVDVRSVFGGIRNNRPPRNPARHARPQPRPSRPQPRPSRPQPRPSKSKGLPSYAIVLIALAGLSIVVALTLSHRSKSKRAEESQGYVAHSSIVGHPGAEKPGMLSGMWSSIKSWGPSKKGTPESASHSGYDAESSRSGPITDTAFDPGY